jgi:hypothetical protein
MSEFDKFNDDDTNIIKINTNLNDDDDDNLLLTFLWLVVFILKIVI